MENAENKTVHIDVVDFKNNRIICYLEDWLDHMANDKRNHELEGLEDIVITALTKPFSGMRYHDTDYPNRMSYYGPGVRTRYVKVSVEFSDSTCVGKGEITTAYPTNNMKPLEKPEW